MEKVYKFERFVPRKSGSECLQKFNNSKYCLPRVTFTLPPKRDAARRHPADAAKIGVFGNQIVVL